MLSKENIKDYLVNGFEHDSMEEACVFILDNDRRQEARPAVEGLLKVWKETENLKYELSLSLDAEKQLDLLVSKHLGAFL